MSSKDMTDIIEHKKIMIRVTDSTYRDIKMINSQTNEINLSSTIRQLLNLGMEAYFNQKIKGK